MEHFEYPHIMLRAALNENLNMLLLLLPIKKLKKYFLLLFIIITIKVKHHS